MGFMTFMRDDEKEAIRKDIREQVKIALRELATETDPSMRDWMNSVLEKWNGGGIDMNPDVCPCPRCKAERTCSYRGCTNPKDDGSVFCHEHSKNIGVLSGPRKGKK
jgi:hypothetical protein